MKYEDKWIVVGGRKKAGEKVQIMKQNVQKRKKNAHKCLSLQLHSKMEMHPIPISKVILSRK